MTGYGLYSVGAGLTDLLGASRLEWQVNLALVVLGVMLVLGGLFVRVRMPGSIALSLEFVPDELEAEDRQAQRFVPAEKGRLEAVAN